MIVFLGSSCESGAIRLADGPSSNEGRVEICYQNVWGSVYDSSWEEYDAAVVCNQLGFDRYSQLHYITVLIINITLYGVPKNKSVPMVLSSQEQYQFLGFFMVQATLSLYQHHLQNVSVMRPLCWNVEWGKVLQVLSHPPSVKLVGIRTIQTSQLV